MADYILFSVRLNAWIALTGTGTSDWMKARVFTREAAHELCSKHVGHDGTVEMIPVEREFVERLAK